MFGPDDQHLNDQQRSAVDHDGSPLLVVAGAGSGKTGVLAHRVASLLRRDVPPERICLLTFSRRAAHELLSRAGRLSDTAAAGRVWGGTFHAVANRVLRLFGQRLGLDPGFSILDGADVVEVFGLVRHDLGFDHHPGDRRHRFPRAATLASIYDRVANTGQSLAVVLDRSYPWCTADIDGIRTIFGAYAQRKRERQLLDYNDLLLCWRALGAVPGLLAGLFDHVLVDEYQDINTVSRPTSWPRCVPTASASPSWATTPRPFTVSGRPRPPTSPNFPGGSPPPRSSASNRTTARPRRFWPWPTR